MIMLDRILKVYRFNTHEEQWERSKAESEHFIAYKLQGNTTHAFEGKVETLSKDMIMIANREDMYTVRHHDIEHTRRGSCIAVHFTTALPFSLHFSFLHCEDHPQVKNSFFRLLDAWNLYSQHPTEAAYYACVSIFYQIVSYIYELTEGENAFSSQNSINAAREYLLRNYADCTLSIANVAADASLSQRRFTSLFAERFHKTPIRFLTETRMAAACRLLDTTGASVSDIAEMTGFTDASYFIRVFKQETGMTPLSYRRRDKE